MREEEIEEIRKTEDHTKINVDTKQKTLQGVMFPIESRGLEKLEAFKRGLVSYVRWEIVTGPRSFVWCISLAMGCWRTNIHYYNIRTFSGLKIKFQFFQQILNWKGRG